MRPIVEPAPTASAARRRLGSRTSPLPGVGDEGIRRLAAARVLVIGAGGLGSPVVALLAGAGLARLTIVDPDVVDPSNLARQTLFTAADVGRPKARVAAERASAVDPEAEAVAVVAGFAPEIVPGHDVVVDAADSVLVTRAASDACAAAGVPLVWGSALGSDGQVSVFWDAAPDGAAVDFHDLHPDPFDDDGSCALDGVVPALCGVVGSVMAGQVFTLVTGVGDPLLGRVVTVDARTWRTVESPLRRGPASRRPPALPTLPSEPVRRIAPAALEARLALRTQGRDAFVLVDVRTDAELEATGVVPGAVRPDAVPAGAEVVVYCARGPRADAWATANGDGRTVTVLDGGMTAWLAEARPTAERPGRG
ncbi:HesA/MoeB/ThiF family protein [Curtobacterium sp. MCBD17_035]|uniref:HesA/MoeB/ThiF family protein n=1 Tax=Curtobacterium sp. MCBD17_035 TaxID=2175673 RepID=UPI000DA9039B|nr:HesA/MoeB/ThiF family protein [Curtobacterium sp. MCBD17_035]WIB66894.1 HesA/MoeB/ThiF family protein [Curtobacterium sp. MCBD17_035]